MRIGVLGAVLSMCLIGLCSAQTSHASIRKDANIPAEPLGAALQDLAKVYELQLLYHTEIATGLKTQGAVGSLTSDEALTKVLSGTGLAYKFLDSNTITVYPQPPSQAAAAGGSDSQTTSSKEEGRDKKSQDFRLAQANQANAGPQVIGDNQNSDKKKKKEEGLSEIVVTGSRIPIRADEGVQPVIVYTRGDIERSGRTTAADFLNTLPDVSLNSIEGTNGNFGGETTVQLHGLPVGTTLTLINGRRVQGNSNQFGFFDLSNIPVAALDRIEVLPVGSSAIYGSDALAGAVNFILRKDFDGFATSVRYGEARDTHEENAQMLWGQNFDRGSFTVLGSFQRQTPLYGADRRVTSTNIVPPDMTTFLTDACDPGTVYSLTGTPLPGLGGATQVAIPSGISGRPTLQQLLAGAGKVNLCNPQLGEAIIPDTKREGALATFHYDFADALNVFAEIIFSHEHQANVNGPTVYLPGGSYGGSTIGANNPFNPFDESVGISYSYTGNSPGSEDHTANFFRPLIGVDGKLFGSWRYEVTAFLSRDQSRLPYIGGLDPAAAQNALNSDNPGMALNPFASPPAAPGVLSAAAAAPSLYSFRNELRSAQAVLRGPAFEAPTGPVDVAIGAEHDKYLLSDYEQTAGVNVMLERTVRSAFGEMRVPIIAGAGPGSTPMLVASAAGRYDRYSDFGRASTWQGGLEFRPIANLLVRAGYATSFQAPNLESVDEGVSAIIPFVVNDPLRGNASENISLALGGNPNLKPQLGTSKVLGLVWTSSKAPSFHATVNAFAIDIREYVNFLGISPLLSYPSLFPGAVVRAPPTPQDTAAGYPGVITRLNYAPYNYGDITADGVDFDVRHKIDTRLGAFSPYIAATDTLRWRSQLHPGLPSMSGLGQPIYFGVGFAPHWKATAGLGWSRGSIAVNTTARYIGAYKDYQDTVPNNNTLGNIVYVDMNTRWSWSKSSETGERRLRDGYLEFGVINLANRMPNFAHVAYMYDVNEYDLRGRFIYVGIGIKL